MTFPGPAPTPDPLVEALFTDVLLPPTGYRFLFHEGQLLYPVMGQDKWRLLLQKEHAEEIVPVFIEGSFILKLSKALNAMQRELNQAVSDDIGEPCPNSSKSN